MTKWTWTPTTQATPTADVHSSEGWETLPACQQRNDRKAELMVNGYMAGGFSNGNYTT